MRLYGQPRFAPACHMVNVGVRSQGFFRPWLGNVAGQHVLVSNPGSRMLALMRACAGNMTISHVPRAQVNDTVMFDIETGKVKDFIKFDVGQLVMVTGGRNVGRVGTIVNRQRHKGSFDIILVKDSVGHEFATRRAPRLCVGVQWWRH